jgi:transcription elongation factor Elf1
MTDSWRTTNPCGKCAARVLVSLGPSSSTEPGLAIFYCPACGQRCQVEHPAGCDPLSITAALIDD